ncbi:phage antirepressor KilAC domain-containing protein, partial [Streptosporangium sp. NPDC023615]|uniref:phage antirepressor KilAC domain-containing protein n=1 Tax=Streptosporangium sp. NPDC023615 TaxID=3154794 RepID=UPI00343FBF96
PTGSNHGRAPRSDPTRHPEFDGTPVLTATLRGVAYYELAGMCSITEHINPSRAAAAHVRPGERITLNVRDAANTLPGVIESGRGNPNKLFITREAVNRLILDSRVPGAVRLKAWLADDVMPAIEDTGTYTAPGATAVREPAALPVRMPDLSTPEGQLEVLDAWRASVVQTMQLSRQNRELVARADADAPKVAAHDRFLQADGARLIREVAKVFGWREGDLRAFLVERKVLFTRYESGGRKVWDVHARHLQAGRFKASEGSYSHSDGRSSEFYTLYVTPKGVDYIGRLITERETEKARV